MAPRSGITLHLERLEDLFSPPSFGEFGESADLESGIERLVEEVKATHRDDLQVTVVIPEAAAEPQVEERLAAAIRRYAVLRGRELQDQLTAQRHDGVTSLLWSIPAVAVLSALSVWVTGSNIGTDWETAIDGILIVLLWVALWYPLDALFWYGRPLSQELRALHRLEAGRITVQTEAPPAPPSVSP